MRTAISIRVDKATKEQARSLFARLGIDITTAITLFLRQAVRQQKLPFEVALNDEDVSSRELSSKGIPDRTKEL